MNSHRRIRLALIALLFLYLGNFVAHAVVDRAVCSASDPGGATCTVAQLKAAINEEVNAVDNRAPMDLTSVSGTDTYVGSVTPTLTSYTGPQAFWLKPPNANTGASTLNINSIGAKALVTASGTALSGGDLLTTNLYFIRYYATADEFRVITSLGSGTAPGSAPFVTIGSTGALTAERALTAGAALDLTDGGANSTATFDVDLTELNTAIFGSGTFTTLTFDAGAVDPVLTFGSGLLGISAVTVFTLDDEMELRFNEEDANGSNYKGFKPPAAITANTTCTLEDDANFIPDSCVGDGSDANTLGSDGDKGDITVGGTGTTLTIDAGAVNDTALAAGAVDGGNLGEIADDSITADDIAAGAVGTSEAGALDTADVTTGTWADARVDGSLEADEVNPTLGSQTQGNFQTGNTAGVGIAVTQTPAEGFSATIAFDYTDQGASPALAADACQFTSNATVGGFIVCEGDTADAFESRITVTDPTADRLFTIPNADSNAVQPLTCGGTDKVSAISAAGVVTCTADSGAAGGDSITVNTTAVVDPDFDSATPAAAAGGVNVTFQTATNDISAYVPNILGKHTIYVPAGAMLTETTTGCAAGTVESATNLVMYATKDCDGATQEGVQFMFGMPKSSDEGTVTFRVDWTAASGSGDVLWLVSCLARSNDDAIDTAFGTEVSITDTVLTALDVHQSPESGAVTAGGTPAENDNWWCRIQRDADAAGDTLNGVDAKIIGVRGLITYNALRDD